MSGNPQAALQAMLANNPAYKDILPVLENNHGDYRKTFFDIAAQRGVDPQAFIDQVNTSINNI